MRKLHVLFLITFCIWLNGTAQTLSADSLKKEFQSAKDPSKKLSTLFLFLKQGQSLHTDTLLKYAHLSHEIALNGKNNDDLSLSIYYIAYAMQAKGLLDSALLLINTNIDKLKNKEGNRETYNRFTNLKAHVLIKKNDYKAAMQTYFNQLQEAEARNDTFSQVVAKTGIGWIKMEMDQPAQAIPWFFKAIATSRNPEHIKKISAVYSNISACFSALHKNDSAQIYIDTALSFARRDHNLTAIANCLNIQANIFIEIRENKAAEKALNEAIAIRKQIGDPFFIVSDMTQLAIFYSKNAQPEKGIALSIEGIAMADSFKLTSKLPILYEALAENYKTAGNYAAYGATLEKIIALKDSIYNHNSAESLAEFQVKYELQKKENTIIRQQLDLVKQNALIQKITAGVVLLIMIASFIFIDYKRRQKMNLVASIEKEKLLSYQAVIAAEEKERKRIAANLHDNLGAYAAAISLNIDQVAAGGETKIPLRELRSNSGFMVSMLSDTIWALKKESQSLTTISDRLKVFIQRLEPSHPGVRMEVKEDIENDIVFSPIHAFQLFQIMQEAINNALRHSAPQLVLIEIESHENWKIKIIDDGSGLQEKNTDGNGLANMKMRSVDSGWNINWRNNTHSGTIVEISPA